MSANVDGSATCDRCGAWLMGYGVLYGMVTSDLNMATGGIRRLIFCYVNDCRTAVLAGHVAYLNEDTHNCTECPTVLAERSIFTALLASDVDPSDGSSRSLAFCYSNGSRDRLLAGNLL